MTYYDRGGNDSAWAGFIAIALIAIMVLSIVHGARERNEKLALIPEVYCGTQ